MFIIKWGKDLSLPLPTVHIRTMNAAYREEDYDVIEAALEKVLERDVFFQSLYDLREFKVPPIQAVYWMSNFVKSKQQIVDRYLRGSSVVLHEGWTSLLLRKMVDIINSIIPPPCPVQVVHTMDEADKFISNLRTPTLPGACAWCWGRKTMVFPPTTAPDGHTVYLHI